MSDTTTDPRLALVNLPEALGLLTAIAHGRVDDMQSDLDRLLTRTECAEGVIKALCVLVINGSGSREELESSLRHHAVSWHAFSDEMVGETMVDSSRLQALASETCPCGHSAWQHGGHVAWPFWEVDLQTREACDATDCNCRTFKGQRDS